RSCRTAGSIPIARRFELPAVPRPQTAPRLSTTTAWVLLPPPSTARKSGAAPSTDNGSPCADALIEMRQSIPCLKSGVSLPLLLSISTCLPGIEQRCMSNTLTRTICCKLDVDDHDTALAATQRAFTAAATWIARVCWDEGITNTPAQSTS